MFAEISRSATIRAQLAWLCAQDLSLQYSLGTAGDLSAPLSLSTKFRFPEKETRFVETRFEFAAIGCEARLTKDEARRIAANIAKLTFRRKPTLVNKLRGLAIQTECAT